MLEVALSSKLMEMVAEKNAKMADEKRLAQSKEGEQVISGILEGVIVLCV